MLEKMRDGVARGQKGKCRVDGWREVNGWNVLGTVEGREERKEKRGDRREK